MPNDVNINQLTVTYADYSAEKSSTTVITREFADNATYSTARDDFLIAMDAVTLGVRQAETEQLVTRESNLASTNPSSQREVKWLVSYEGSVDKKRYSFTLPCADPTALDIMPGTDLVDLTTGNGPATVSAIENFVKPNTSQVQTANVVSIRLVGRNI